MHFHKALRGGRGVCSAFKDPEDSVVLRPRGRAVSALGHPIARAARVVRSSGLGGGLSVLGQARFKPGTTGPRGLLVTFSPACVSRLPTEWSQSEKVFTGHGVFRAGLIYLSGKEVCVFVS